LLFISTCTSPTQQTEKLKVVTTTTIIGDVVSVVGGEHIDLTVLLPADADPHSFSPAPKVVAEIENADIVVLNGFGLEESLEDLIAYTAEEKIIFISEGVETIEFDSTLDEENEHGHGSTDPHVWMNPLNVKIWVNNIAETLSEFVPTHAEIFKTNAMTYLSDLDTLHYWTLDQLAQIPLDDRVLVTDHDTLSYFAEVYKFNVIGVILPGGSTIAEPSAQDIARLENAIEGFNAPGIFTGTTVNTQLAERISVDTGVQLVPLYTGSLSNADGPAPDYISMMRYNVTQIVGTLKP
jgi:ABC-type Zn uptake system ZnuABC Zn-binding protein ZnuA